MCELLLLLFISYFTHKRIMTDLKKEHLSENTINFHRVPRQLIYFSLLCE